MPEGLKGEERPADEQQKARALSRWENEGGAKAAAPKRPRNLNARGGAASGSGVAGRTIKAAHYPVEGGVLV